jgi:hypothetical protein
MLSQGIARREGAKPAKRRARRKRARGRVGESAAPVRPRNILFASTTICAMSVPEAGAIGKMAFYASSLFDMRREGQPMGPKLWGRSACRRRKREYEAALAPVLLGPRAASRPEMALQVLEEPRIAPGNDMASQGSYPQDLGAQLCAAGEPRLPGLHRRKRPNRLIRLRPKAPLSRERREASKDAPEGAVAPGAFRPAGACFEALCLRQSAPQDEVSGC